MNGLLATMTWHQLLAWNDYANLEPFGEERADLRAGTVASVIANVNRDPKRRPNPFRPVDFMPDFGQQQKQQSTRQPLTDPAEWARIKGAARAIAGGHSEER